MGDFKKNPDEPYEVRCPNKIRKRIAMHERRGSFLEKLKIASGNNAVQRARLFSRTVDVILDKETPARQRGSMWSRFTGRVKKFLK